MRLVLLFVIALVAPAAAQTPRSPLFAAVGPDEYFGETYTDPPEGNSSYVFFEGEPLTVRITIANEKSADLSLAQADNNNYFTFELWPAGTKQPLDLTCTIKGRDINVPRVRSLLDEPLRLEPSQSLHWVCPVDARIAPGSYRLRVFTTLTDIDNQPIVFRVDSLDFDLRARSTANRAEVTRREALRLLTGDRQRLSLLEASVQRLLSVHPTSHEAHLIRGHAARLAGDDKGAKVAFGVALDILERDQDQLLLRFKSRDSVAEMKARVRSLAER
jgi:hypothetical protein